MDKAKQDRRLRCKHCNTVTWMTDYTAFMRDHDRPDGRRCLKASAEMEHQKLKLQMPDDWNDYTFDRGPQ